MVCRDVVGTREVAREVADKRELAVEGELPVEVELLVELEVELSVEVDAVLNGTGSISFGHSLVKVL